jgi:hypothetical protein
MRELREVNTGEAGGQGKNRWDWRGKRGGETGGKDREKIHLGWEKDREAGGKKWGSSAEGGRQGEGQFTWGGRKGEGWEGGIGV